MNKKNKNDVPTRYGTIFSYFKIKAVYNTVDMLDLNIKEMGLNLSYFQKWIHTP